MDDKIFQVASSYEPSRSYLVDYGFKTCECLDFVFNRRSQKDDQRKCKHLKAVELYLGGTNDI